MISLLLALALAVNPDPLQALEERQQQLFDQLAPSVVFITAGDTLGSGVVVADGLVLTNQHVVGKANSVSVVLHDGRKTTGMVIERASDDIDLALVRLPIAGVLPARIAVESSLKVGSWVAAIGHGEGSVWSFNVGMVSNLYDGKSAHQVFQTQIPLNPGNSGGPIIDRHGRVVGIVTAGIKGANSINFGIDTSLAFRTLVGLRMTNRTVTLHAPEGVPIFMDGKNVGVGPMVVLARPEKEVEAFAVIEGKMIRARVLKDSLDITLGPPVVAPPPLPVAPPAKKR